MIQYLSILLAARKDKMDERGASAVEYGLLVALIAAVIIAAVIALGGTLNGVFESTEEDIRNGTSGS